MNKTIRIYRIIIILLFLLFFGFHLYTTNKEQKKAERIVQKSNLIFSGIITNIIRSHNHAFGIITLKLLNSNTKAFDERDLSRYYCCVIKDSVAEVYNFAQEDMVGNTLYVNTPQLWTSRSTKKGEKDSISILPIWDDMDYDFVRKHTAFK